MQSAKLLCNSYILSQLSYCPLVWMFCSKEANNNITKTHNRALRVLSYNMSLDYNELLSSTNSMTIHQKNLNFLAVEIFKSLNNLNPIFMKELFVEKSIGINFWRGTPLSLTNNTKIPLGFLEVHSYGMLSPEI